MSCRSKNKKKYARSVLEPKIPGGLNRNHLNELTRLWAGKGEIRKELLVKGKK